MVAQSRNCLVMLVEDNPDVRESVLMLLELKGYDTVGVEHGADALRQLCRMEPLPCLILLDLMLPVMDGWQLIQELQRNAVFAKIPVVLLSAISGDHLISDNVVARLTKTTHDEQLALILEQTCLSQKCAHTRPGLCPGRNVRSQLADLPRTMKPFA